MVDLNNIKAIWHTAGTGSLPTSAEMLQQVRKFRGQKLRNKWLVIVVSIFISALIICVLIVTPFKLPATYIGGGLMALSGLLLAATNIRSIKRFYRLDDCTNLEFLAFIEKTRQNQVFYYKRTQAVLMLVSAAGLMLFLFEAVAGNLVWSIAVYAASAAYLLIMWFIVRPHYFKKNAAKLNAMRERLETIIQQLK